MLSPRECKVLYQREVLRNRCSDSDSDRDRYSADEAPLDKRNEWHADCPLRLKMGRPENLAA